MEFDLSSAPKAAGGMRADAQPVAAPLTRAAIFMVVTLNPGPAIAPPFARSAETSPRWCVR